MNTTTAIQNTPESPPIPVASPDNDQPSPARKPPPSVPFQVLQFLASLRVTVVLFILSILLVFYGTLAQIDSGIWTVMRDYFRSFYVFIPFQLTVEFGKVFFWLPRDLQVPGSFPFIGGTTLGLLLLVNLLAAHAIRFKISWKRSGILILHLGLIIMMLGELFTGLYSVEGKMVIMEGESSNYVYIDRKFELAIVDPSDPKNDRITVVPSNQLKKGTWVSHAELPFDIELVRWLVNAKTRKPKAGEENLASAGFGTEVTAVDVGEVSGVDTKQEVEQPACYVKLRNKEGTALGTYLFWTKFNPQEIQVGGKTYQVSLQMKHDYKPFSLELIDFRFDRYPGTEKPKNFSSQVRLRDEERGEDREITIRMNEPLRHRGETFYQASWDEGSEKGTVLQVVRNPAWLLPYISCGVVTLGMLIHFGITLIGFLQKRALS